MDGISRDDYFESRSVCKVGLRRLRVIECAMAYCTPGGSDSKSTTLELSSRTIPILGCFIDDLVESWEDVVTKLNFGDSGISGYCCSNSKTKDALFRQRSIEDSINAVFFAEVGGAAEDAAKLDVLAENFGAE